MEDRRFKILSVLIVILAWLLALALCYLLLVKIKLLKAISQ
jgi:hypothetical protein